MSRMFAFVLLAALCSGCSERRETSPAIARVGGEPIALAEFEAWIAGRPGAEQRVGRAGGAEAELGRLIELVIIERELEARGLADAPGLRAERQAVRARAVAQERELLRRALFTALENGAQVGEDLLRERYETTKDRHVTSRIRLRLLAVDGRDAAVDARRRIAAGEGAEVVAEQVLVDEALLAKKGDLGWMLRTEVPVSLRSAAFGLTEVGELSEPFQAEGHWNVVELLGRDLAVPREFESLRPELERSLRREQASRDLARLVAQKREELGVEIDRQQLEQIGPPARRTLSQSPRPEGRSDVAGGAH